MAATTTKMKGQSAAAMTPTGARPVVINGSGNVIQIGNNNESNSSQVIQALLLEISEQRKLTERALAQIDNLMSLLARLAARSTNRDLIEQYGADSKNTQRQ